MKIDFEKVGIISSYFSDKIEGLYITKLMKLFYYLDFISYKIRGSSITNDTYYKLPYGPVPSMIKSEIDLLSSNDTVGVGFKSQLSKYIELQADADDNGKMVHNKLKNYSIKRLSDFERKLIDCLIEEFKDIKAKAISNQTHKEGPWLLTSDNSVIDYNLANQLDVKKILPKFVAK